MVLAMMTVTGVDVGVRGWWPEGGMMVTTTTLVELDEVDWTVCARGCIAALAHPDFLISC
jgi:hypothetical protein